MENSLVVLLLLDKKKYIKFWWYHAQVGFEQSQQTQFDIFHTKMLQNTSRCHVTASIWILCNILENIPLALDVHAQRVLKYNLYLFMTLQLLRLVDLMCFCSKRADDVEKDCKNQEF